MTHILDTVEPLDVLWRAVCRSPLGFVEFCDGNYEAADQAWTQMREEAELIGWKDFLEDRSEPDHVEVLLLLGEVERARRVLEHLGGGDGRCRAHGSTQRRVPGRCSSLPKETSRPLWRRSPPHQRFRRFRSSVLGSCSSRDSWSVA